MNVLKLLSILVLCSVASLPNGANAEIKFGNLGTISESTIDTDNCTGTFKFSAYTMDYESGREKIIGKFSTTLKKQGVLKGPKVFVRKDFIESDQPDKNFQGSMKGQFDSEFKVEVDAQENSVSGYLHFSSPLKSDKKFTLRDADATFYIPTSKIKFTKKKVTVKLKEFVKMDQDNGEVEFNFGAFLQNVDGTEKELFTQLRSRDGDLFHISKILAQTSFSCPIVHPSGPDQTAADFGSR